MLDPARHAVQSSGRPTVVAVLVPLLLVPPLAVGQAVAVASSAGPIPSGASGSASVASPSPGQSRLDLDADTDRSGAIDGSDEEERLEDTLTFIVLNNCDDDDPDGDPGKGIPDNWDDVVNGADDASELEPFVLRRASVPEGARVVLRLDPPAEESRRRAAGVERRVRIFDAQGTAVLGAGWFEYELTRDEIEALAREDLTFRVEALDFGVRVRLQVLVDGEVHDELHLESAPLLLTPNTQLPTHVFVGAIARPQDDPDPPAAAKIARVDDYVAALQAACERHNAESDTPVQLQRQVFDSYSSYDEWAQDEFQIGYTQSPRATIAVLLDLPRSQPGSGWEGRIADIVGPGVGYQRSPDETQGMRPGTWSSNSINYGGNLEISPPVPGYPLGRVYYGGTSSRADGTFDYIRGGLLHSVQELFEAQRAQAPFSLSTDWLAVGHVDEVVALLPSDAGTHGFVVLLASPRLGLDILRRLPPATALHGWYRRHHLDSVGEMFAQRFLQQSFEEFNLAVDQQVFGLDRDRPGPGSFKGAIMAELGVPEEDVYEIPVLFQNFYYTGTWNAVAQTPDIANMLSLGRFALLPDPFIPEFRDAVDEVMEAIGVEGVWIDDTYFHSRFGGIHCSTNDRRQPFADSWWDLDLPGARR